MSGNEDEPQRIIEHFLDQRLGLLCGVADGLFTVRVGGVGVGVLTTTPGPLLVKEEPSAEAAPCVPSSHCEWKNLEARRVTQLPSIKREREREFIRCKTVSENSRHPYLVQVG